MTTKKVQVVWAGDIREEVEQKEVETEEKEKNTKRIFEQRRKYPKCCITCGGDGGSSDVDDDAEDEISGDLCPDCYGSGKCPRCAERLPGNWKAILQALYNAVNDSKNHRIPKPVQCRSCGWEDGDPPVL